MQVEGPAPSELDEPCESRGILPRLTSIMRASAGLCLLPFTFAVIDALRWADGVDVARIHDHTSGVSLFARSPWHF